MTQFTPIEAARLWKEAKAGNARRQFQFAESLSQGDLLPALTPAIRRTLVANYQELPTVYEQFTSKQYVPYIDRDVEFDTIQFAQNNIPTVNAGDTFIPGTLPRILNREKYPQLDITGSQKYLRASTFGEALGVDWQAIVNSRGTNINLIDKGIAAFAQHSSNLVDSNPAKNLINAAGLSSVLTGASGYHALPGNVAPANVALSDIQKAIALAQSNQIDGVDVYFDSFVILTAPANVGYFNQVLSSRKVTLIPPRTGTGSPSSATVGTQYEQTVDLGATVTVVGYRWLSRINPTMGPVAWFLVPGDAGDNHPGLTTNFLEGYEDPGFWVKDSNARNYNGGDVPFLDGDFDSDAIQTKVRFVNGSNLLWAAGFVASNGSGS